MTATDAFDQLERLADLKSKGIITDTEFEAKKQELLSGQRQQPASDAKTGPKWGSLTLTQKQWFVAIWLLLFWPVAFVLMWIKPQYYRGSNGAAMKTPVWAKALLQVLVIFVAIFSLLSALSPEV